MTIQYKTIQYMTIQYNTRQCSTLYKKYVKENFKNVKIRSNDNTNQRQL